MATSAGPTQNNGRIEWWSRDIGVSQSTKTVQIAVDAYFKQIAPYYQAFNGTKSWSGYWGSGSAGQAYNLGAGARVKVVTFTKNVTLTDSRQTLTFSVTTNHWFGSTSSTWSIAVPARYAQTPSGLSITRSSDTSHRLNWSRNSTYTSVVVQRRVNNGSWTQVARPSGNAATWTDTTTKAGNKYEYRVAGVGGSGQSGWSNTASVFTSPLAPTGVTAERIGTDIRINATGRPAHATSFNVRDGSTVVASGVSLPWTHKSPNPAVPHTYSLQGVVTGLTGAWSAPSNTVQLISAPLAPAELKPNGSTGVSETGIPLGWKHSPVDASAQTAAEVRYRLQSDAAWTTRDVTTAQTVSVLFGSGEWEWQVRTKGAHPDWSPWSAVARFTAIDRPGVAVTAPDVVLATRTVRVEWAWLQAQGRAQSSWEVALFSAEEVLERRTGSGADSALTFETKVDDGSEYRVTVRAATGEVWSEWAEQSFTVLVVPAAPAYVLGEWGEDSGAVTIEVNDGRGPDVPPTTNRFTNPRTIPSGELVEIRRNLHPNPNVYGATHIGWGGNPSAAIDDIGRFFTPATGSLPDGGSLRIMSSTGATANTAISLSPAIPVTPGQTITMSVYALSSADAAISGGYLMVTPRIQWSDGKFVLGSDVTLSGAYRRMTVTAVVPEGVTTAVLRPRLSPLSAGAIARFRAALVEASDETLPYFDGDNHVGVAEISPMWDGPAGGSPSTLTASAVQGQAGSPMTAGGDALLYQGADGWLKIDAERASSFETAALVAGVEGAMERLGIEPGHAYTALATVRIAEEQVGELHPAARSIAVGVTIAGETNPVFAVAEQPPNEPGEYPLRLAFTVPSDAENVFLSLVNGGMNTSIEWSHIGLVDGNYTGPFFHGSSGLIDLDGSWLAASWDGLVDQSSSTIQMAPAAARADVERSVDDGATWELVAADVGLPVVLTDPEALSAGVTLYRVTTYSVEDAMSVATHEVESNSPAVWLSGGSGFSVAARLPYSPTLAVTAARQRVIRQYDGRSLPVAHAGEALSRVVDSGGLLLLDEQSPDELADLVQTEEPVHLYRDPDGRRIFGMLGDVQLQRESHAHWAFGFQLTETEK